ncbi:hypothetical protein D3C72_1992840 [compost metagenome]
MAAAISAVLGLEWRFDGFYLRTKLFEHRLEHVIVEQTQPAIADLQGDVAVTQVIGGAGQFEGVGAGDVQQLLGAGADADDAAVFSL